MCLSLEWVEFANERVGAEGWSGHCIGIVPILFYANIMQKLGARNFFPPTPTTNLSNLLIGASIYCYLYALNEELKDYPKLLSDF